MGAQGFYRQARVPSYSYTQESSSPLGWELGIAFLTLSQVENHFNWVLTKFPSDRRCLNLICMSGEAGVAAHEYSTQTRCYIIAQGSDWLTHTSHHFFQTLHHTM